MASLASSEGITPGHLPSPTRSTWLHRISIATLIATFPLIFMGGLVTSHGAGLSVPDWPNSYGYNMFLFPPSMWVGGIFYEHTHRLLGCLVGFLAIIQCVIAWRTETRLWVKWLCTGVLLSVIVQGLLGGFRVTEVSLALAIIHGCFAQIVLGTMAVACVVTSRWWASAPNLSPLAGPSARLPKLAAITLILLTFQLIAGAMMRHKDAGLAIHDLPLAYGHLIPPTTSDGLATANALRLKTGDAALAKPVTLYKIWLHFTHRVGAVIVTTAVLALVWATIKHGKNQPAITLLAWLLLPMITAQVTLGLATVYFRKPADIATVHHTLGAILLMTVVVLGARSARLFSPRAAQPIAVPAPTEAPSPATTAQPNGASPLITA